MNPTVTRSDTLEDVEFDPDEHEVVCEFCGPVDGDGGLEAYYDHMADVHDISRDEVENPEGSA